jgi:hypothetical protein
VYSNLSVDCPTIGAGKDKYASTDTSRMLWNCYGTLQLMDDAADFLCGIHLAASAVQ